MVVSSTVKHPALQRLTTQQFIIKMRGSVSPLKAQLSRPSIMIWLKKETNTNSDDMDIQNNSGSGRWTTEEQYLYEQYVKAHPGYFTKQTSKGLRAFKRMAQVIKTRTAIQCRSHHQKMTVRGVRRHKRNSKTKSIPIQVKTVEAETELDQPAEVSAERTV